MTDDRELSSIMRRAMAAQASEVTDSSALAERIIRFAGPQQLRLATPRTSRLRPWAAPMLAAVLIAFLVGSVVVGIRLVSGPGQQPAVQPLPAPVTTSQPAPHVTASPNPSPSRQSSTSPSATSAPTTPVAIGFRALDLTWVSTDVGWALGTVPCGSARCEGLAHTTDGGASWSALPNLPTSMGSSRAACAPVCVTRLRFADSRFGYAIGGQGLYLTSDGGRSWQSQPLPSLLGSSDSVGLSGLEIGRGTVLRSFSMCIPGCPVIVQRSSVGGTVWQNVPVPSGGATVGAQLVRAADSVVVLTTGNPAGGAGSATSVLFSSVDSGSSWRKIAEPCPPLSATATLSPENDSTNVSVAGDGTIAALCAPREQGSGRTVSVVTSENAGQTFAVTSANPAASFGDSVIAASASDLLVSTTSGLLHSTDRGAHWSQVLPQVGYVGFETPLVGRALGASVNGTGSATVWTTHDGGTTWAPFTFAG